MLWTLKHFPFLSAELKANTFFTLTELVKHTLDTLLKESNGVSGGSSTDEADEGNIVISDEIRVTCKKILYYLLVFLHKAEETSAVGVSDIDGSKGSKKGVGKKDSTSKTKKGSGKGSDNVFDWSSHRSSVLYVLDDMISSPILSSLWSMGIIEENFLNYYNSYLLSLLEAKVFGGSSSVDSSSRSMILSLLLKSLRYYDSSSSLTTLTVSMINLITKYEHMSLLLSELCSKEMIFTKRLLLTNEIFYEICNMLSGGDRESSSTDLSLGTIKNLSFFLENYSKLDGKNFINLLPCILVLLDSSAHQIRSCVIQSIGYVVISLHQIISLNPGEDEVDEEEEQEEEDEPVQGEDREEKENKRRRSSLLKQSQAEKKKDFYIKQYNELLSVLLDRLYDINPYTRSNVLKTWILLVEKQVLPIKTVLSLTTKAMDRVHDRNVLVRKYAINCMTKLIENNPFSAILNKEIFSKNLDDYTNQVNDRKRFLQKEFNFSSPSSSLSTVTSTTEDTDKENQEEVAVVKEDIKEDDEEKLLEILSILDNDETLLSLTSKVEYYSSAIDFITTIESSLPKMISFIDSKNGSDVIEVLSFFANLVNFNVSSSIYYYRNVFKLIWHNDVSIQKEVLESFISVYFTNGSSSAKGNNSDGASGGVGMSLLSSKEIAYNLIKLITICSSTEMISVEEIIGKIMNSSTSAIALNNKGILSHFLYFLEKFHSKLERERLSTLNNEKKNRRQSSLLFDMNAHQGKNLYSSSEEEEGKTDKKKEENSYSLVAASIYAISIILSKSVASSISASVPGAAMKEIVSLFPVDSMKKVLAIGLKKNLVSEKSIDFIDFPAMKLTAMALQHYFLPYLASLSSAVAKEDLVTLYEESVLALCEVMISVFSKLTPDTIG
jgi:hypothetical protein